MLVDFRKRFRPFSGMFVPMLVAAMLPVGCGADNKSGDSTPTAKEAVGRQKDMYNFMKDRSKTKSGAKTAARVP